MPNGNKDILTDLRSFLLSIPAVVALVGSTIRSHRLQDGDKTSSPKIILKLPNARQLNTLNPADRHPVNADVLIECRAATPDVADELGEAVKSGNVEPAAGLNGYAGPAGDGLLISAYRTDFDAGDIDDDDDNDDMCEYEHVASYSIWYQPTVA